jgi:ankyrin repeat protein
MITLLYLAQGDEHSTTVDVAAMLGQTQIVREILDKDLKGKFQKNKMGRSPLHYAAR